MKNRRNKTTHYFKLGTLLLGVSLILLNCEKDEVIFFKKNNPESANIKKSEKITLSELPEVFIHKTIKYLHKENPNYLSKQSKQEILQSNFENEVSKVTAENRVVTYTAIPKNIAIKSNDCEALQPNYSVVSMNVGADTNSSDLYTTNFYALPTGVTSNLNGGASRFHLYTATVNLGLGSTFYNDVPPKKCKKSSGSSGGGGLIKAFKSFWDKIKSIFKVRRRAASCPGSLALASTESNASMAVFDDDVFYDLSIPLEKGKINTSFKKFDTTENFDCACENDEAIGMASYLGLNKEETLFILNRENEELRNKICACVKNNNYSQSIILKIKEDLNHFINNRSPLNGCLKIETCQNGFVKGINGVCECPKGKVEDSKGNCVDKCETTAADLKKMFPKASAINMNTLASVINKYGKDFGIDTDQKLQHFLSQAGHETGGFKTLQVTEGLYYKTASLIPKRYSKFTTDTIKKPTKLYAGGYIKNSKKLANAAYCCKFENGNEASGDGWRYRGRGIFQLTWKENYRKFKNWYNSKYPTKSKNFVSNPALISNNDTLAIMSGLWYYKTRVLDKININSNTTVNKVTKPINSAKVGLKDRKNRFQKAKTIITCK